MKAYIVLIALLGVSDIVFGAQKIDVKDRVQRSLNYVSRKRNPRSLQKDPEDLLGLDRNEHLKPQEVLVTSHNTVKTKYTEDYKGLPIIGESIVLEQTSDGKFTDDASGSLLDGIAQDVPSIDPALSPEEAFVIARSETGRNTENIMFKPDRDISLAIYTVHSQRNTDDSQTSTVKAVLVYQVTITIPDPYWPIEMRYIIDANTGKVLHKSNLLESYGLKWWRHTQKLMAIQSVGGNKKSGRYTYGKDRESLKVETDDGIICKVQNEHVAVVHLNFTSDTENLDKDLTQGYTFECMKGIHDEINGGYSPLSDAYFYFNKVYEMFDQWYGRKPLKHRAVMAVHYNKDIENAFYMTDHNVMVMGDGKSKMYPLVAVGVVAHEICHGYTSEHSNLEYSEQSGGMNEAFSDMASAAAQSYISSKTDWMIGYEIAKNDAGILRWIYDPPMDNSSVASLKHYCPGMDVHFSSGIFNKAFYLLANRPDWDVRKAFHVFLTANTLYWQANSDFADGACGAVKAAKDLGFSTEDVESVFRDVNIKPCVKSRYNFQTLIDTSVSPKRKFEKYFDTSGISADKITIEVWIKVEGEEENNEAKYNLSVTFNGHQVATLKSNKSDSVDITDVQPGRYHITIEGEAPKLSVYVITDHIFHGDITADIPGTYGPHGNTSFNLDESDAHRDLGIVVRASGDRKPDNLFTRFGEQVDMHSMIYDIEGRTLSDNLSEALYCSSRPGLYGIAVLLMSPGPNNFLIDVYKVVNLYPRTDF